MAKVNTVKKKQKAVAAKIASVSLTPLIPFNPYELMSSFASRQLHPPLQRHRAMKTGAEASAHPINVVTLMG